MHGSRQELCAQFAGFQQLIVEEREQISAAIARYNDSRAQVEQELRDLECDVTKLETRAAGLKTPSPDAA